MPRATPKKRLSAGLVPALALCGLLVMGVPSMLFAASKTPGFPRLSDNTAASRNLEVRRQIKGHVQAMFALPVRNEVLVVADGYLWRFSADGRLLDTLKEPGWMHRNGISFGDDSFVDWVHTGTRVQKPYAPQVNGNVLDATELEAVLAGARVVAFGRDDESAWAWLWDGDKAWKMDISRHRDRVDTYCTPRSSTDDKLSWRDTCLEGLGGTEPLMVEVRPGSFRGGYGGEPVRVEVVDFDRRRYHLEGGVRGYVAETVVGGVLKALAPDLPGGLPERYWFGDAHTRLRLGDEVLQFKVFVARRKGDYEFLHAVDWWDPSSVLPGASPWLRVRMRGYMEFAGEEELWEHYRGDFGLYAVRPRQSPHDLPAPARPVPAWEPAFEGPETKRDAVTGTVALESGAKAHRWLRARPARMRISAPEVAVDADGPPLDAVPVAMRVEWGSPWDGDEHTMVQLKLDPATTRAAFSRLPRGDGPATLLLRTPDLFGEADDMQLLLRRGDIDVALEPTSIEYLRRPAFRPWHARDGEPTPPTRVAQMEETAQRLLAGDHGLLPRFQAQAEALARDTGMVARATPFITQGYALLLSGLNSSGRADASMALVRHYLAEVHPRTDGQSDDPSVAYNTSVVVSQTLAVAVHRPQDAEVAEAVMETLLGPGFDPDDHPNSTLLYNLACYHSLQGDKAQMLRHVAAAVRLGKPAEQFRRDRDFERYWNDPDFKAALSVL